MDAIELSPYLAGIQKVEGSKLSDKFNTLNRIAKKLVESKNQNWKQLAVDSFELPETLIPLVQVEVARLLRQPEDIVEALKSDDSLVFSRALKVKWFFNGSIENCTTIEYYQTHILPFISLQSRIKIIKTLADNLIERSEVAEKLYSSFCEIYGENQAHPLLKACSESFIWNCIMEYEVRLDNRIIRFLFYKYPELILEYLKLSYESRDPFERNIKRIDLKSLRNFLPRLVKKYPYDFVELVKMHRGISFIKLSKTRTELFLMNCVDDLLDNVNLFISILDLETVAKKLNDDQFKYFFAQLFPQNLNSFDFDDLSRYLQFFPANKKISLMTSTFKEVYGVNLLDYPKKITAYGLKLFPRDTRIELAKIKLEKEPGDEFIYSERSWVCYLPCEESVECIKTLIKKTSDRDKRSHLLKQLIYTCIVNSDNNALLEVLKYIATRHKNEHVYTLLEILDLLYTKQYLRYLTKEHWDVIYDLLKFLHVKNELGGSPIPINLLISRIRFDLNNNYPITDKINFLVELRIEQHNHTLYIFDNIVYKKKCLEEFIEIISSKILNEEKYNPDNKLLSNLIRSMYNFNNHNLRTNSRFERMSIKNYPGILSAIEKMMDKNKYLSNYDLQAIRILQREEKDLCQTLITEEIEKQLLFLEPSKILKTTPEKFISHWEYCLDKCMYSNEKPFIRQFLKSSRWYQDLPIKFTDKCLRNVAENKSPHELMVLALLIEGSAFEQVITPFIPSSAQIDIDQKDARIDYWITEFIPKASNIVNPPVSLDFILKFCIGDYIHTILDCLVNISQRTTVTKVISFAMALMNRPVSIKKHGIRLFCTVADVKRLRSTLIHLWRSESHETIRTIVFSNIFKIFISNPYDENWDMIRECIEDLKPDDTDTFERLMKFNNVSNEYIADYIELLFWVFRKLGGIENGLSLKVVWSYIIQLLKIPNNIGVLFSEEQHDKILDNYVVDLSLPKDVLTAGHYYLMNCYIVTAENKLEERLNRFKDIFFGIVNNYWDVPQENNSTFYPANYFVHNLTYEIIYFLSNDDSLKQRVIYVLFELFDSVLQPYHDAETYVYLTFLAIIRDEITPEELANEIAANLQSWILIFSSEFLSEIAKYLDRYLNIYSRHQLSFDNLDIIEALIALNHNEATILAAHFLSLSQHSENEKFRRIVNSLKNHYHPAVVSIAYVLMNCN